MQLPDTSLAFWPVFTAQLTKEMRDNGHSFHIIAAEEDGPMRLLQDLQTALPDCRCVVIDMHDYSTSFSGMTWEMGRQLGFEDEKRGLSDLKLYFERHPNGHFRLFLGNFHQVLKKTLIDKAYNNDFVGSLNNLRQMPNVRLVITTNAPGNSHWMHLNGENQVILSSLFHGLEERQIPAYSREEVREEIQRRLPAKAPVVAEKILEHFKNPYSRLDKSLDWLAAQPESLGVDWDKDLKGFLKNQKKHSGWQVRLIRLHAWITMWWKVLGGAAFLGFLGFVYTQYKDNSTAKSQPASTKNQAVDTTLNKRSDSLFIKNDTTQ